MSPNPKSPKLPRGWLLTLINEAGRFYFTSYPESRPAFSVTLGLSYAKTLDAACATTGIGIVVRAPGSVRWDVQIKAHVGVLLRLIGSAWRLCEAKRPSYVTWRPAASDYAGCNNWPAIRGKHRDRMTSHLLSTSYDTKMGRL